jgi:hypothetical protein
VVGAANFFRLTVASQKPTPAAFTERRLHAGRTMLELMVLADLRRKGFTVCTHPQAVSRC